MRLPCAVCGVGGSDPCLSRTTGKVMKSNHGPRAQAGKNVILNADVQKIEGDDDAETMWMFTWLTFGLQQRTYPKYIPLDKWNELHQKFPELTNQYWGAF